MNDEKVTGIIEYHETEFKVEVRPIYNGGVALTVLLDGEEVARSGWDRPSKMWDLHLFNGRTFMYDSTAVAAAGVVTQRLIDDWLSN